MKRELTCALLVAAVLGSQAAAGIIFNRGKPKDPATRVPELIGIVKTDGDEKKRSSAAAELRQYDPAAFPDMVPVLIDVLMSDPKPSVRAEAVETLGKFRPVTQQVGAALEAALAKDASMQVRMQARSSLMQYHWAGYRSAGPQKKDDLLNQTKEPPLADPEPTRPGPALLPAPTYQPAPAIVTTPSPRPTNPPVVRPPANNNPPPLPSAPRTAPSAVKPAEATGPDL